MKYELNNFYNEDCLPAMKTFADNYFQLAICDPPYFNGPNKLGYYGNNVSKTKVKRQAYKILGKWDVPTNDYFNELLRISKEQIIWGINYFKINNLGTGRIIWDKINDFSTFSDGEIAYCSLIDTVRFYRFMWNGMLQGDMKNKEKRIHPTQKPVKLYKWLLRNYAKPTDKIISTHVGSGSDIIAFIDFGCEYVGFEIDADYHSAASKRIEQHKSQLKMF